jgi:hypothetical protein
LERPWIFVFGAKVVGPDVYNEWYIEYTVANYGKMPAIISKVNNGIEISEKVEPAWPLEAVEGNSLVDAPILASGEQRTIRELIPVQEAEKGSVAYRTTQTESGEQTIEAIPLYNTPTGFDSFFIVKIDYRGPKSIGHGTAACWLYMPPYDLLVRGGEDYNYTS